MFDLILNSLLQSDVENYWEYKYFTKANGQIG